MTKTYDGNNQTTYTLNNGRVIVLKDDEFDEIVVGSEKMIELHEKIIELECEIASKKKEICKLESESQEMLDIEEELKELQNKTCEWEIIDDDDMDEDSYKQLNVWFSDCKSQLRIPADETLKNNQLNYCPKCGGKIKIKEEK